MRDYDFETTRALGILRCFRWFVFIGGLLLCAELTLSRAVWTTNRQVQARARSAPTVTAESNAPPPPAAPAPAAPAPDAAISIAGSSEAIYRFNYELPAIEQIPSVVLKIRAEAAQEQGEDAAVSRAWANHLERFYSAYTNTVAAAGALTAADLLDPASIYDFTDTEAVRRRKIANQYSDAWHQFGQLSFTFSGSYYQDLQKESVPPSRASAEFNAIMNYVNGPQAMARFDALKRYCEAEDAVGRSYNYACSQVFDYARTAHQSPSAASTVKQQMDEQILKLQAAEQTAAAAKAEAMGKP